MNKLMFTLAVAAVGGVLSTSDTQGQGRGGAEWTTATGDAQRSSWVRADSKVSATGLQKNGGFQFLWKTPLHNQAHQLNSLTQPVLLDRLVGFRGFKAIAVVGASADTMYAVDFDTAKPLWTAVLNYSADNAIPLSTLSCPGGLMAAATRPTAALIGGAPDGGGGGGRGGRSGGSVGEPGKGAPNLAQAAPPRGGRGGGGGRGGNQPRMGMTDGFYAMGSDGFVHALNVSNGADMFPPVKFIPENSKPSALLLVQQDFDRDGTPDAAMMYTSTSGNCATTPNGVWAVDLSNKEAVPVEWKTNGGSVAGSAGPTLGSNGLLFAAVGKGPGGYSDSVVALDAKTLQLKDWITVAGADFNSSPIVFTDKNREMVVVGANDGKLYLLDGSSLGGANHTTPLYVTPKYSTSTENAALATWESAPVAGGARTRWILAPFNGAIPATLKVTANGVAANGGVLAFKLSEESGKVELQPAWTSRNMTSPLGPLVVNNVVFALSSGEYRGAGSATAPQRAQRSVPAVLYALDAMTGKELWSSGKQITSFGRSGLAAGGTNGSTVFVTTYDSMLYAFGFPLEK